VDVTVTLVVDRPPEQVFDAMADVRNEAAWNTNVTRAELTSPAPIGLGSTFDTVNRGQSYTGRIAAYERPGLLRFDVRGKPLTILAELTFVPDGDTTRVSGTFSFTPHGIMKVVLPLIGGQIRKDFPKQFAAFKEFCESR